MDLLLLTLAATATAVVTGLGAVPVFFLGERAATLRPWLLGFAAGVMTVASVVGLLLPALDEGTAGEAILGAALGVAFLLASRWWIESPRSRVTYTAERRTALLVFLVLLVHSLPEGFAIGTAYASDTAGLSLFVILAIGAQNVPEGTSVAIPLAAAGYGRARQFWAAVGTSAPSRSAQSSRICSSRRSRVSCRSRSPSRPARCSRWSRSSSPRRRSRQDVCARPSPASWPAPP